MPLHKAQPGDEPALLARADADPYFNMLLISNLKDGLGPDTEVWSDAAGMLMRRLSNWIVFASPDFDYDAAAAIVDSVPLEMLRGMTGRPEAVDPVAGRLRNHYVRMVAEHLAALDGPPATVPYAGKPRRARPADLDAAAACYADAGDMSRPRESVQRMLPTMFVLEDGGEVVCVANVTGETDRAAMVGSVFTPVQHRRKGYAATLVHAMCVDIQNRGKRPCLFFTNPDAGRIYHRLGFRDLGPFRMVRFRP